MQTMMTISGEVIHGNKQGRLIGYPTANIALTDAQIAQIGEGTFGGHVMRGKRKYVGAIFVSEQKGVLEVYILDFEAEIYGEILEVEITTKIRDNRKFASADELKEQIKKDITEIRGIR